MSPVKGSDLAKQIEMARQEIERWPQWLKDAAGLSKELVQTPCGEVRLSPRIPLSPADFID
jgi:hypothetical protein